MSTPASEMSAVVSVMLQCSSCGTRYSLDRLTPGKSAKCVCSARFVIPSSSECKIVPALTTLRPKIGLTAAVEVCPTPVVQADPEMSAPVKQTPKEKTKPAAASFIPKFLSLNQYRLLERAENISLSSGFDHLTCLAMIRGVDSHEYQERTAKYVLKELGGRALLADEVGLGKTIEAGIILKELIVRGLAKRILILTPASLTTQWRDEMKAKFGLHFEIGKEPGDWERFPKVIASIDTAKSSVNADKIHSIKWDLLIIDEAHKLKNKTTLNWKFVNGIRKKFILMLSATPFQNNLLELFNMITILRPGQLYTEKEFKEKFLRRGDPRSAKDPAALSELLRQVMVRNRRGEVNVHFTQRIPEVRRLRMLNDELKLYQAATEFCRKYFGELYGNAAGLVALGYLKQLGSSSFSFRESVAKNVIGRAKATQKSEIIGAAEELLKIADSVRSNVKLEALVQELKTNSDKVLIFTQYRGTQDIIAARLRLEKIDYVLFNGSLDAQGKDMAVGAFRNTTRILLCTESGGEGRNLQFANRLVNYDLPWNPMRVEQRIGRLHRTGQTKDVIIVNLTCEDTIEDMILELLEKKLNLFRLIVGEVDGIIGKLKLDEQVAKMFLESSDNSDFTKKMRAFGDEIETLRSDYESCKSANDSTLSGLGLAQNGAQHV